MRLAARTTRLLTIPRKEAQHDLVLQTLVSRSQIIVKKLEDPNFDHRPQLYDPKLIPTGRFRGIDEKGTAIIELEPPESQQAK